MFGNDLIRCKDKDHLYERILKPTSILTIVLLIVGLITREGMFASDGGRVVEKIEYLHPSTPDIIALIIAVLFIVSVFYFISKRSSPRFNDFILRASRHVTIIYIVQWGVILSLTYINQSLQVKPTLPIAIAMAAFVFLATYVISKAYVKLKDYIVSKN